MTGAERYREVAEETVEYLLRELRLPDGGFASSQDADTDGVEGLTYTWAPGEGAPEELLEPFEDGRFVLRGELDRGDARRGCSRSARGGRSPGSTTRRSRPGTGSRWRRWPRRRGGSARADWLDDGAALGEFLLGPLSTDDGRLHRSRARRQRERHRVPRRLRERRARALRAARRDGRAALARGVAAARAARGRAVRRRRARRLLPCSRGRRAARRAEEGLVRPPDAVRELDARVRAPAARADLRRRRARAARGRRAAAARRRTRRAARRSSPGR